MVRRSVLVLLAIIIISMVTPNCTQTPDKAESTVTVHDVLSPDTIVLPVPAAYAGQAGTGIGFVREQNIYTDQFNRPQNAEFIIAEGEDLSIYLILTNGWDAPKTFLLAMLIDYQQASFALDRKEGMLHRITIPATQEANIPFTLQFDSLGSHDVIAVAFGDPDNLTTDIDYRMSFAANIASTRAEVIIGRTRTPAVTIPTLVTGIQVPGSVGFRGRVYFASAPTDGDTTHASERQMYVATAEAGTPFRFQIVCNNILEKPVTFALVTFLNFHQVTVTTGNVIYVHLNPGEEAIIDASVMLPEEPTVNQLQIVYPFDPFRSILYGEAYTPIVFNSPRIAIDTR